MSCRPALPADRLAALAAAGSRARLGTSPESVPAATQPRARVGDADRERVAAVLGDAAAEGYLRLDELDARLGAIWSARTRADLDAALGDLPEDWLRAREQRAALERARAAARAALRPHLASYVGVMLLLTAIWLVVGVTAGAWYPWPVWPALGWGIGLVSHWRSARGPVA